MATQPKLCYSCLKFRYVKCLIYYRDSIHHRDIFRVTIMIVKIVLSLSTTDILDLMTQYCVSTLSFPILCPDPISLNIECEWAYAQTLAYLSI